MMRAASCAICIIVLIEGALGRRVALDNRDNELAASSTADAEQGPMSAKDLASQAVERACINSMGRKFEALASKIWPHVVSATQEDLSATGTLEELLQQRWTLEDALAVSGNKSFDKSELKKAKKHVKERLFSVKWARKVCTDDMKKPTDEALLQCLLSSAGNGTTYSRFGGNKSLQLKQSNETGVDTDSVEAIDELQANVEKRWHLEQELKLMKGIKWVPKHLKKMVKKAMKDHEQSIKEVKDVIKESSSFSYYHTTKHCMQECKNSTLDEETRLIERMVMEFTSYVQSEAGECKEKTHEGLFCPEGAGPDYQRSVDMRKFGRIQATTLAVAVATKPLQQAAAFGVGFLFGGPVLAGAFVAGISIPGIVFPVSVPLGLAASVDVFPKCRCYQNECKYDEQAGSCVMTQHKNSSSVNPFHKLPYPGTRCVAKENKKDNSVVQCELQQCRPDDYQKSWDQLDIKGTLGFQPQEKGVHNCLSTTGKVADSLLLARTLPTSTGEPVDNTVSNRASLYKTLGAAVP